MNAQEYISSGIIESYVLGLTTPEENAEVEAMCRQYPEVLQARIAFEESLEQQAMQNAIAQPANLKATITEAVMTNATAKIIAIEKSSVAKINWFKYAAAAAIVLLAGSLYWNVTLFTKNKELQNTNSGNIAKLDDLQKQVDKITNPHMKMAAMKGMDASPSSFATVYWDSTSKDVYLLVNNLPTPPSGQQYQLWALLDGKPIDIGMIENDFFVSQKRLLLKMKNASNAQAFAITLEKKGGNPTPEGPMYVMGNL